MKIINKTDQKQLTKIQQQHITKNTFHKTEPQKKTQTTETQKQKQKTNNTNDNENKTNKQNQPETYNIRPRHKNTTKKT